MSPPSPAHHHADHGQPTPADRHLDEEGQAPLGREVRPGLARLVLGGVLGLGRSDGDHEPVLRGSFGLAAGWTLPGTYAACPRRGHLSGDMSGAVLVVEQVRGCRERRGSEE